MKKSNKRRKKPSPQKASDLTAAQELLRGLPVQALVSTINMMMGIIQDRGFKIRDWDEKDKVAQKMSVIGGRVYILAPREKPTEAETHGENGDEKQGG